MKKSFPDIFIREFSHRTLKEKFLKNRGFPKYKNQPTPEYPNLIWKPAKQISKSSKKINKRRKKHVHYPDPDDPET